MCDLISTGALFTSTTDRQNMPVTSRSYPSRAYSISWFILSAMAQLMLSARIYFQPRNVIYGSLYVSEQSQAKLYKVDAYDFPPVNRPLASLTIKGSSD